MGMGDKKGVRDQNLARFFPTKFFGHIFCQIDLIKKKSKLLQHILPRSQNESWGVLLIND